MLPMGSPQNPNPRFKSIFAKLLLAAILVLVLFVVSYTILNSGPWVVPEAAKQVKNPLLPSQENVRAARAVYLDKCAECHGNSGKGDGDRAGMYSTRPANLTDAAHLDTETDGELFYKISQGHKPMPAFRKRLTDEQRWQLVLLIRFLSHPPDVTEKASTSR